MAGKERKITTREFAREGAETPEFRKATHNMWAKLPHHYHWLKHRE